MILTCTSEDERGAALTPEINTYAVVAITVVLVSPTEMTVNDVDSLGPSLTDHPIYKRVQLPALTVPCARKHHASADRRESMLPAACTDGGDLRLV